MAHDAGLAERVRGVLDERLDVTEKRMFGGIAFMVRGHMCVGIVKEDLMVRVGPGAYDALVREAHARPMDFTGRPMKGFLYVEPAGLESDADLERWVGHGLRHATSLPAKSVPEGLTLAAAGRPRAARRPAKRAAARPPARQRRARSRRRR
jgi:TfoX/Sxy family transcriptional regulator of competence genes